MDAATRAMLEAALRPLQLLDRLGGGASGDIFLARDPLLRRTVAVKLLRQEARRADRARFFREAEAVAGISHPNIIGIHAVGQLPDGTPYFIMDYVPGQTLAHRLRDSGPFTVRETRAVLGQVASALAAAHARGIVHRDIKPDNVLFDPDSGRVLVTDFGIAAFDPAMSAGAGDRITRTGTWVGSPPFMSPEQFVGDVVTARSDVYALGLLAFDLLLARGPFGATTPQQFMVAHAAQTPPSLRALRADVDAELDALVAQCLQKKAEARPSAGEVARRLAPGGEAIIEWPPPGLERLRGTAYPLATRLAAGCALLLGPLVVGTRPRAPADTIEQMVWTIGYLLGAVLGCAALVQAVRLFARVTGAIRLAGRSGYRVNTLAEVLADPTGDTGHLISGWREYSTLNPLTRARLRSRRIGAAGATLAAALAVPCGILLTLAFAPSEVNDGWAAPLLAILPALICLAAAQRLRLAEHRLLVQPRRMLARPAAPDAIVPLVPQWYRDLQKATVGAALPLGGPVRRWFVHFVEAGSIAVLVLLLVVSGGVGIVAVLGVTHPGLYGDIERLKQRVEGLSAFRHLRLPSDTSLSPAAVHDLLSAIPQTDAASGDWRTPRQLQETISGSALVSSPSAFDPPYSLAVDSVIPAAFRGLSPAERSYLRGFAGDPRFATFASIARAPGMVLARSRVDSTTIVFSLPFMPLSAMREVAQHKVAQAGLLIDAGRIAEAEIVLREVVSVGLMLSEEGTSAWDAIGGNTVGVIGVQALLQIYERTDRWREAADLRQSAMRAEVGPRVAVPSPQATAVSFPSVISRTQDIRRILETVSDTATARPLRWELIRWVYPASICHDIRSLVRGAPAVAVRMLEQSRAQLVRTPEEDALFTASVEIMERLPRYSRLRHRRDRVVQQGIRLTARLLRNPRLENCYFLLNYL